MSFIGACAGNEAQSVQYNVDAQTAKIRTSGSASWRHNNPALLPLNISAKRNQALGQAYRIAIFPDRAAGEQAFLEEIERAKYGDFTLGQMVNAFIPDYIIDPPLWDEQNQTAVLPHIEPITGMDVSLPISDPQAFLDLVTLKLGWQVGTESDVARDFEAEARQASIVSNANVLINGRTAVHSGSGGVLSTVDVCLTKIGKVVVPIPYGNIACSSDAASVASSVKIQGNGAANIKSNFSKSTGDQPGNKKGIASRTLGKKAEFLQGSFDVYIEGKPAVRQGDLMVSNNKNTPPAPLSQPGGATPAGLDVVLGAEPLNQDGTNKINIKVSGSSKPSDEEVKIG